MVTWKPTSKTGVGGIPVPEPYAGAYCPVCGDEAWDNQCHRCKLTVLESLPEPPPKTAMSNLYESKLACMEARREYDEHFVQQDGMCAGCGKPHYKHRRKSVLRPDRDPETGRIRRLLCSDCLEAER